MFVKYFIIIFKISCRNYFVVCTCCVPGVLVSLWCCSYTEQVTRFRFFFFGLFLDTENGGNICFRNMVDFQRTTRRYIPEDSTHQSAFPLPAYFKQSEISCVVAPYSVSAHANKFYQLS
jgi:hypothetical protein